MATVSELLAKGWSRHQAGRHAEAEEIYQYVIQHAPGSGTAWCYLGILYFDQKRFAESEQAYSRAISLEPGFTIAWSNRANTLVALQRYQEAEQSCRRAIQLDPSYASAHLNLCSALSSQARWTEAESSIENALTLMPDHKEGESPLDVLNSRGQYSGAGQQVERTQAANSRRFDALKNRGILKLIQGRFADGWKDYEARFLVDVSPPPPNGRLWRGECLEGKSILVCSEQGLGDTLHFVRCLEPLADRAKRVVFVCQSALFPLLKGLAGRQRIGLQVDLPPPTDYVVSLLSLPGLLGFHSEADFPATIPYLQAEEARILRWRETLEGFSGRRIGLAWQGNPEHSGDATRSAPLRAMQPLWSAQDASRHFFSLQKGHGEDQLSPELPVQTLKGLDQSAAFLDTAAVMMSLDAVVTTDSAVAHLAGAMGRPVYLALSGSADWRWLLDRDDSPWYPSMRIYRQGRPGDWEQVFQRIRADLAE